MPNLDVNLVLGAACEWVFGFSRQLSYRAISYRFKSVGLSGFKVTQSGLPVIALGPVLNPVNFIE